MEKINDIFPAPQTHATGGFYVSIVKIDLVKVKIDGEDKRVEQYLICTRAENEKSRETFVYRDYATFKKFDADVSAVFFFIEAEADYTLLPAYTRKRPEAYASSPRTRRLPVKRESPTVSSCASHVHRA